MRAKQVKANIHLAHINRLLLLGIVKVMKKIIVNQSSITINNKAKVTIHGSRVLMLHHQ